MSRRERRYVGVLLAALFILMSAGWAEQVHAQEKYPTRAIEIIVPYAAGGGTDMLARHVATYLKKKWGVPVNTVSKPGGRGIPAILEVIRSTPDGYTMLMEGSSGSSMLAVAAAITKEKLPFDIMNRTYLAVVGGSPFAIFVNAASPFKTLKDFIGEAKKNTEDISFAAGAPALDYTLRQLFHAIGMDVSRAKPVLCSGASEAVVLAAGGHITIGASAASTAVPAVKAQTIRALLTTSPERWPALPDVPTSAELGYPQVNNLSWNGVSGPPKLPSHIATVWTTAIEEMVKDPGFISQVQKTGAAVYYRNARDTTELVRNDIEAAMKLFR